MPPDLNPCADIPAAGRRPCPLTADPRPECYCYEMNSADISDMQRFCGRNHRRCRIYRKTSHTETAGFFQPNFADVPE